MCGLYVEYSLLHARSEHARGIIRSGDSNELSWRLHNIGGNLLEDS